MDNNSEKKDSGFFYSKDWRQEAFAFGSLPFFDVMIDKGFLFLIKMSEWRHVGFKEKIIPFLGLFTGAGLLAVFAIGDIRKSKYYKTYRLSWINSDNKLISQDYEKHIFLKIPLNDLEDKITFGKNKIYISYNGKKIVLTRKPSSLKLQKGADAEFTCLNQFLEKYFIITSVKKVTVA